MAQKKTKANAGQKTQDNIRKSLIAQLKEKGADVSHFMSLIDDYMYYYQQEKAMHADVRKNKRTIKSISAAGKQYDRENPAVKDAVLYNRQKLAILSALGLEAEGCNSKEDDL
jgi:hypothetical protein